MAEPETRPIDPLKGLSGPERMFREELMRLGVKLDGFLFRPPVNWMPQQFGFRITWEDGKTRVGLIPWDVSTYHTIIEEAKNP